MENKNEKLKSYPKTENFEVYDTVGVPHPFCITHHHVAHASDKYCGMLTKESIIDFESKTGNPSCGMRGCNLSYEQHEQALIIKCKIKDDDLLRDYLKSLVKKCQEDGFTGFVLLDSTGEA